MVCNGKPENRIKMDDLGDTPIFGSTFIYLYIYNIFINISIYNIYIHIFPRPRGHFLATYSVPPFSIKNTEAAGAWAEPGEMDPPSEHPLLRRESGQRKLPTVWGRLGVSNGWRLVTPGNLNGRIFSKEPTGSVGYVGCFEKCWGKSWDKP